MLKSEKQPKSINFLEPVYAPNDIWSNAYIWLVEVGKYLLILVELIVLGVFFSRFVLDKKNNDLTEEINNKIVLLSNENWKKNASLFSNYQVLFADAKKVREGQEINSTTISELLSGVPSSLTLENIAYSNEGKVSINIRSVNLETVKNYESALKNNPDYYDVRFNITKDGADIIVRITFSLVPTEG